MKWKALKFSLLLSIVMVNELVAQNKFLGLPAVEHFDANDYQGHIRNWAITQDQDGIIFIANQDGLLEYDGSNWRKYPVDNGAGGFLTAYADPSGRIYVGGSEMGYYYPVPTGSYEYHSLNYLLPEEHHNLRGGVNNIFPYKGGFVFVNWAALYFYDYDSIKILPATLVHSLFTCLSQDKLYMISGNSREQEGLFVENEGLSVFNGESWDLLPEGKIFAKKFIAGIHEFTESSQLVFTMNDGIYLIRDDKITPFASAIWEQFNDETIKATLRLSDGSFAIGTQSQGLYIINQQGQLTYHFQEENGLKNSSAINDIFQDTYGNIWLAKDNGIELIEWNSPFSFITENLNLSGVGNTALVWKDKIYLGTSNGLYQATKNWPINDVTKIDQIKGSVYAIQAIGEDLFVGGTHGTYQLIDDVFKPMSSGGGFMSLNFKETSNPNVVVRGNQDGLYRMEKVNKKWSVTDKYDYLKDYTQSFEFDEKDRLWVSNPSRGIYALTFSEDYRSIASTTFYDTTKGLPANLNNKVFKIEDVVIFSTVNGIYTYDEFHDIFVRSEIWNDRFNGGDLNITAIQGDEFGNIFYHDTNQPGWMEKNIKGDFTLTYSIFKEIRPNINGHLGGIEVINDNNVLFTSPEGFIHYNKSFQPQDQLPNLLIRYVITSLQDSVMFYGNYISKGQITKRQPMDQLPKLRYDNNSLIFGYSVTEFSNSNISYRYQLEGFDLDWSNWTEKTEKEYTNLREGDYNFMVQALHSNEELSTIQSYRFEISPPWYRTLFAYVIYGIGSIGFLVLGYAYLKRKHRGEIGALKEHHLKIEISQKKSQLAAATMHLVEKVDFLFSVKGELSELLNDPKKENLNKTLRRLIRSIERNANDQNAWAEFETHFDNVHGGFLKKMRTKHPKITSQDIRLCAYLRLNLSTKEMASLLGISVRGVQIARHRLRVRLGLKREMNLTNFILDVK